MDNPAERNRWVINRITKVTEMTSNAVKYKKYFQLLEKQGGLRW